MQIELDTEIMQTDFGSQPALKSREVMRKLPCQAKGIQEFVVNGLSDLPNACQPATQRFGPTQALAELMRGRERIGRCGHAHVRSQLYLTTLTVARFTSIIMVYYDQLRATGKPMKI